MKACMYCKQEKPLSEFGKDASRKDGLLFWCKPCVNDRHAQSYERRRAKVLEVHAVWRESNRELARKHSSEWAAKNPLGRKAHRHAYRARKVGAAGRHTAADIAWLLAAQRERCAACGSSLKDGYHVDHVLPLALGGSNDKLNLQLLCPTCNCKKGSKDPLVFAASIGRLV